MTIPVSQFVLPVGVTGLTVNGNTPTPEPGGAPLRWRSAVLGKVGEDTHKGYVWVWKTNFTTTCRHPQEGISI